MASKAKTKWCVGDIVSIPLPNDRYAFARLLNNFGYEFYALIANQMSPPLDLIVASGVSFYQSGTDKPVKDGTWRRIGHLPFESDEQAWLPPQATSYDFDTDTWFTSKPQVMIRGDARNATAKEVKGLDIWSFCADEEAFIDVIEDRLIHGNHAKYKVRDK